MATVTLKGNECLTNGDLPKVGDSIPDFELVASDLSTKTLDSFNGKKKVLNIFPSIDTGVCAISVKQFNAKAGSREDAVVLNISADLPFAHKRFCGAEGIENAVTLSTFRGDYAERLGVKLTSGPLAGCCARAVVVVDENNKVIYQELVPEITHEPNYDAALTALS